MAIDDPTEAIRSEEILPLLEERFEIIEKRPYGGTLLNPVLDDIAANFETEAAGTEFLEMLFDIEDALMDSGEIGSDFTYLVAKRRG